jgi:hypothetical protein
MNLRGEAPDCERGPSANSLSRLWLTKRDPLGGSPHAPCGMAKVPNICGKMAPGRARQEQMCREYSGRS